MDIIIMRLSKILLLIWSFNDILFENISFFIGLSLTFIALIYSFDTLKLKESIYRDKEEERKKQEDKYREEKIKNIEESWNIVKMLINVLILNVLETLIIMIEKINNQYHYVNICLVGFVIAIFICNLYLLSKVYSIFKFIKNEVKRIRGFNENN